MWSDAKLVHHLIEFKHNNAQLKLMFDLWCVYRPSDWGRRHNKRSSWIIGWGSSLVCTHSFQGSPFVQSKKPVSDLVHTQNIIQELHLRHCSRMNPKITILPATLNPCNSSKQRSFLVAECKKSWTLIYHHLKWVLASLFTLV